jgi:O-antigen ligase
MWVIVISTTIFSIGGIIYFYFVLGKPFTARLLALPNAPGTPVNTIPIISLCAAVISLFLLLKDGNTRNRLVMLVCFIGTFLGTLLTYSRGAFIALIVSFVVILFILYREHKKKLLALIIVLFIAIGGFTVSSPLKNRLQLSALLNNGRLDIWYTSLEMIKDCPLAGIGFGMESFKKKWWNHYNSKVPVRWRNSQTFEHPHNFILNVTVRLGIIGLIFVVLILFSSFRMSITLLRREERFMRNYGACFTATLVGVLVAGMFGKIVSGQSAIIFYTILAMITILWRIDQGTDGRDIKVS